MLPRLIEKALHLLLIVPRESRLLSLFLPRLRAGSHRGPPGKYGRHGIAAAGRKDGGARRKNFDNLVRPQSCPSRLVFRASPIRATESQLFPVAITPTTRQILAPPQIFFRHQIAP